MAAAALLALNVTGPGAQEIAPAKDYAVGPAAYLLCSTFNNTVQDSESDNLYYAWATGYLSALNSGRLLMQGTMRHLNQSPEWQKAWLRAYCREHPDHSYGIAVFFMWNTFPDGPSLAPQIREFIKRNPEGLKP